MCNIELNMYESGVVDYPYLICSGVMGPCISIGIYDKVIKRGYMRHQPNADHDDDMRGFIEGTLIRSSIENVTVYVTGGSFDKNDDIVTPQSVIDCRSYIESLIYEFFGRDQVIIQWIENGLCSELILDTSTGQFSVKKYEF